MGHVAMYRLARSCLTYEHGGWQAQPESSLEALWHAMADSRHDTERDAVSNDQA